MDHDLITVMEASKYLRVSSPSIYKLIRKGDLPHTSVGSRLLIPRTAFLLWVEKNTSGGFSYGE